MEARLSANRRAHLVSHPRYSKMIEAFFFGELGNSRSFAAALRRQRSEAPILHAGQLTPAEPGYLLAWSFNYQLQPMNHKASLVVACVAAKFLMWPSTSRAARHFRAVGL